MNKIKLTTIQLFVAAFLLCGLIIIQTPAAPTLRANGKIAFTSDRDGNSEIYLMNDDGTGQTRLTNSPDREDYPTWSPDGSKIAFMKQKEGVFSINLMNADGTNQTELTRIIPWNPSIPFRLFSMSWSPDGAKIAFQDSTDIFTINVDGSNRANLTNGQFINYQPSWSPDGSQIAFARSIYSHGYYPKIYTMNKDGSNVRQIAGCQFYCETVAPDWSPDGERIAFTLSGMEDYTISLVNPDGTNLQHINSVGVEHPNWSPDGTKIVSYNMSGYYNIPSQIWMMNRNGSGQTQLTNASSNNFHPDWQPLVPTVNVATLEELYSAVNNPANAGNQIIIASGIYMLSATDANGAARPNGGRLELQENMSLLGVAGNRSAVVIDAMNLPASSYTAPIANTGAIRMGKGSNAIEWLTIRNAVSGGAGIIAYLSAPGTAFVRIAHISSTGNARGIDVRNIGAAEVGRVINAEIVDNDLYNNTLGAGMGLRIINQQGTNGSVISATLNGNRSYNNYTGLIVQNTGGTNFGSISVYSSGDRFFDNGAGAIVFGGLGTNFGNADGNTVNFTALGTNFENNNNFSPFDVGGLLIIGGENTVSPNGVNNNTVNVELRNCRLANNQEYDLAAFGARSIPASIGTPGTNNRVEILLSGISRNPTVNIVTGDSIPETPGGMNSVTLIRTAPFDFDGDGRGDLSVFRPSNGTWYLNRSQSGFSAAQFGLATDKITPADYDGDGKTDVAVYRDGTWYWLNSSNGSFNQIQFGLANDIPQPADFDGDGRAELAVYRNGIWWTLNLTNNQVNTIQFGLSTDKPVVADYDGDGRADQAVYRGSGEWHLNRSSQGYSVVQFGLPTDKPVPADYDGDGKTDQAVYRDGTWYILRSNQGFTAFQFGIATDIPVPADYDGDGKTDAAVYRDGTWWILQSTSGISIQQFGLANDKPVPATYLP